MAEVADANPHGREPAPCALRRCRCRVEVEDARRAVTGFLVAMHSAQGPGSCLHRIGCAEHTLCIQRKSLIQRPRFSGK